MPPAELEALLLTLPQVQDCIVIPVLNEEAGEIPRAYVVVGANQTITEEEITEYVSKHVAHYKKLRGGVRFVENIPKSASGKLLRRVQVQMDRATA